MPRMVAPNLLSWASDIEPGTVEQASRTARLPILAGHVALMPDAHVGLGATVGTVIPTTDAIIPAAVGVDIGCVDASTEYLSPTGWRRIDQYDGGEVMQYDPATGTGSFTEPSRYVVLPCEEFLHLHTKYGINQALSPEHRVLYWRIVGRNRRREMRVTTAAEFTAEHERLALGIKGEFETTFTPALDTKLALSDAELRVQVMVHADAHIERGRTAILRLKKSRKIERARVLLADAGIAFSQRVDGEGVTCMRFLPPRTSKSCGEFWPASAEQLAVIVDEVFHWDGSQYDHVFFTRDRASADFMHYAFSVTGRRGVLRTDENPDGSIDYRVFAHGNTRVGIAGVPKTNIDRIPSLDGRKYCFTVPTGFWVMRRGGNIAMTGNCGMVAAETTLTAADLPDSLAGLMPLVESGIPAGVGRGHHATARVTRVTGLPVADPDRALAELGRPRTSLTGRQESTTVRQFGTLGSGNHFVEVCLDERDRVWTVLHSGSRGIGNQLATAHIDRAKALMRRYFIGLEDPDLAYLVQGTEEFTGYVEDMLWAQRYAMASRAQMASVLLASLFRVVGRGRHLRTINCHHNFSALERHHGRDMWITRKGAIRAATGDQGVIPGSMGTRSYIVRGLGNEASYHSCSHGAGRRMSRGQARRTLTPESLAEAMGTRTWNAERAGALLDEHPDAYKDIERVMADQHDLVEVTHTLRQIFNYKG